MAQMKQRLLLVSLASMAILAGCGNSQATQADSAASPVIVMVGEKSITQDDLYQDLKKIYGAAVLRTMIVQEVLEQNAKDLDAIKAKTEEEYKNQVKQIGGEEVLKAELARRSLGTIEDYKNQLYVQQLFRSVIEGQLDLSDEAIQEYYENEYEAPMEAQHILVDTEEEAKAAIERIQKGESFEDVARELSKDGTAANGGNLGTFTSGKMVAEFEAAVKAAEKGELIATPVKTQFGYHVIKVLQNGEKVPYAEANKEEVKELYVTYKIADAVTQNTILSDLVKKAKIEIKENDLKDAIKDLLDYKAPTKEASSEASQASSATESAASSESESASESGE